MNWKRFISVVEDVVIVSAALLVLYAGGRVFVCDRFRVRGVSMEPTLHTGQWLYVNKLLMGARIYKTYDFDQPEMSCFRMPGLRQARVGDVMVFNYPEGWENGKIGFKINYVYAKRCLACPGDSISIRNGYYVNSRVSKTCVPEKTQRELSDSPDSLLLERGVVLRAYRYGRTGWTIRDFGPLYVPRRGDCITLDGITLRLYSKVIEYETGRRDLKAGDSYTFLHDYYFLAGDNVLDSKDSRYFGLVPEPFIVGIVPHLPRSTR